MQRSNSNAHLDDSESFSSISGSGADLSRYQEQLARERNSRTLNLRHLNRISIAGMLQNTGHQSVGARGLVDGNHPFLESAKFIEAIKSNNISQVTKYTQSMASIAATSPKKLNTLIDQEFIEFIIDAFSNYESDAMLIQVINILEAIFPHCGLFQEQISLGIIFSFYNLFESTSPEVILSVIGLISCMSNYSSNARDSFLSFELYTNLISIAKEQASPELTRAACNALYSIFSNPEPIDNNENFDEIARSIVKLLSIKDKVAVTYIIDCLVEMTNKYDQLLVTLFNCGVYPLSVEMLKDEELVGPTLHLVGNLSVAEPQQVNALIESGLLPILNELLRSEYVTDCFWVLSNLLERIPNEILPHCDSDFVKEVIDIILSSSIEVQKEGSFFLCTLILRMSLDILPQFMNQTIIDILVQTINCGMYCFILRCIDALIRLLIYTQNNLDSSTVFFTALIGTDIRDNLNELIDQETGAVYLVERASYLLGLLDNIEKELKV